MTTSAEVPGRLPVAVNGHAYMANPNILRATVPVIRQQADTSTEAGEQSLNPAGLWRRSQESWHHGAGQDFLDGKQGDEATDPHRFRSSKGVDVWTRGQVSLLHPTLKVWSTASTNLYLVVARQPGFGEVFVLYVADGNELYGAAMPFNALNTLALQQGTGWTVTNATIAAIDQWFDITATGTSAPTLTSPAGTSGVPVDPGRRYGFVFQSTYLTLGMGRLININATWYDAAGATISSTAVFTSSSTDSIGTFVFGDGTAPSNAAYASVTISYANTPTPFVAGEKHRARTIGFGPYDDLPGTFPAPDNWFGATIQAGQPAQPIQSLATDGSYVWAALGTSGLHRNQAGLATSTADVPAAPASGQISLVGYANGFLLAAGSAGVDATRQNSLWLVTDPLGTPALSLIKTHPNTSFVWTGIGPGRNCVYAWGNSGGNGEVYKILFDPNTGSLSTAASFATYLADGETIHALQFYAGGIIMGTGRGVRIGQADGSGNIDYGPLVPTLWPVRCLEPQDRYCWFGWTKYDATNSGLGRIDLGFLTDSLKPAWASDLMTSDTTTGDTVAAVTFAPYGYTANQRPPVRVFSVAGKGVYIEDPGSRVLTGTLSTGTIRFSTSEPKTTRSLDVRHHALPAGAPISAEMQRETSGTWTSVGSSSTTGSYGPAVPLDLQDLSAESVEFRLTLDRPDNAGTDYSRSPELTRWTAKALPTPSTIDETFEIPLIMRARTATGQGDGAPYDIDVAAEIAYLKGLERTRTLIDLQVGSETITKCYVAASKFEPDVWNDDRTQLEGIYTIQVSTARG